MKVFKINGISGFEELEWMLKGAFISLGKAENGLKVRVQMVLEGL